MALFTYNRYMGEENVEKTSGVTLEQIQKAAHERQEQRKVSSGPEAGLVMKNMKRKKAKLEPSMLEAEEAAVEGKRDKKAKRKKRKLEEQQEIEPVKECETARELPGQEMPQVIGRSPTTGQENPTEPLEGLSVITHQVARQATPRVQYHLPQWATHYHPIEQDIATHSLPLDDFDLPEIIRDNLIGMGVSMLFPVQAHVIPELLVGCHAPLVATRMGVAPSDICVCAPTGCGKTLSYVVPIAAALMERSVCRLRALVVLPSQELALQVYRILEKVCHGMKVEVGVACGGKSLKEEMETISSSLGSMIDILVATPGRLVSHVQENASFTLQDLRYLVIDEADRLFEQKYHNWLESVMEGVRKPHKSLPVTAQILECSILPQLFPAMCSLLAGNDTPSTLKPHPVPHNPHPTRTVSDVMTPRSPFQKLLFSATISLDPEQLSLLELHRPKLFSVEGVAGELVGQSTLPSTLEERVVVCTSDHKPLVLLHLLLTLEHSSTLCFAHSRQATHRLSLLLQQYEAPVAELSSSASHGAKSEIIGQLRAGKIKAVVCSDGMARGMDIPGVQCVINYDAPSHFRSYLHRVGRTARAGGRGTAYTLLTDDQVSNFNHIMKEAGRKKPSKVSVTLQDLAPYLEHYTEALKTVGRIVQEPTQ